MKRNVGRIERVLRLSTGIAAGAAALLVEDLGVWRIPLGIVSVAGLATGTSRYCPINQALGIDNYRKGVERRLMKEARGRKELKPTPGLSQY